MGNVLLRLGSAVKSDALELCCFAEFGYGIALKSRVMVSLCVTEQSEGIAKLSRVT